MTILLIVFLIWSNMQKLQEKESGKQIGTARDKNSTLNLHSTVDLIWPYMVLYNMTLLNPDYTW